MWIAPLLQNLMEIVLLTTPEFPHLPQVFYFVLEGHEEGKQANKQTHPFPRGSQRKEIVSSTLKSSDGLFSKNIYLPCNGTWIQNLAGLWLGRHLCICVEICLWLQNSHPFINSQLSEALWLKSIKALLLSTWLYWGEQLSQEGFPTAWHSSSAMFLSKHRHGKSQLYFSFTLSVFPTRQQKQALGELGEEIWIMWVG